MKRLILAISLLTLCLSAGISADAPENKLLKFKRILSALSENMKQSELTTKQRTNLINLIESRRIAFYVTNELQDLFKTMITDTKSIESFYSLFTNAELASLNRCLSLMTDDSIPSSKKH